MRFSSCFVVDSAVVSTVAGRGGGVVPLWWYVGGYWGCAWRAHHGGGPRCAKTLWPIEDAKGSGLGDRLGTARDTELPIDIARVNLDGVW